MIVNLAVHCQYLLLVRRKQWLSATLWVDNRQSLMGEYGRATTIYSTPVRSAVTDFLTHLQCLIAQRMRLLLYIQYCYYSTHNLTYFKILLQRYNK